MPGSASDYTENAVANALLRGQAFPTPARNYIALFTADPTDANVTSNEVTGAWYARQDAAQGDSVATGWSAPVNGVSTNAKVISFPAVTGSQVTVTHIGVYDAPTGGNLLFYSPLEKNGVAAPKTIYVDDILIFDIGSIELTVS